MSILSTTPVLSLLREPVFRRLWAAGAITWTMRWLEILVIGVFVYDQTRSPFLTALMTTLRLLPSLVLGVVLGELAERLNRKWLMTGGLACLAVISAVLASLALLDMLRVWHIGLGALIAGVYGATDMSVRRTMIGEVAGGQRLSSAMGLDSTTNNATRVVGPFVGGVLLETVHIEGAFILTAVAYGVAAALAWRLPDAKTGPSSRSWRIRANIGEGLAYIRARRVIVGTLFVTMAVNFWGFSYIAMLPVIGRDAMSLSAELIGLLVSAEGVGALAGALSVTIAAPTRHLTRIYLYGSFLFLVCILAFSQIDRFALAIPVLLISGVGISGFSTMQSTIMLLATPPELRSRVMGVLTMCIGAGPLGLLHVGVLADWLGAQAAVGIIALEGLVALALAVGIWPELVRTRTLAAAERQP